MLEQLASFKIGDFTALDIAVAASLFFLAILAFLITLRSLKKLKTGILPFYPFDLNLPRSKEWSVAYFFIGLVLLGMLFFLLGS